MNIDTTKVELIDWISNLNDQQSIRKLLRFKYLLTVKKRDSETKIFGSGKHLFSYISDDFNEPIDIFLDYQK